MEPSLRAIQPKIGMAINSFLKTKRDPFRALNWTKTSNMVWCLGAIRASPAGAYSRPRISTRIPQITRRSTIKDRLQNRRAASNQRRGATRSGTMAIA